MTRVRIGITGLRDGLIGAAFGAVIGLVWTEWVTPLFFYGDAIIACALVGFIVGVVFPEAMGRSD